MGTRLTALQQNGLGTAGPMAQYPSQLVFNDFPVMCAAVGTQSLYHSYRLFSRNYPDTPVVISPGSPFVAAKGFELEPPIRIETDFAPESVGFQLSYDIMLYASVPNSLPQFTRARYCITNRGLPAFASSTFINLMGFVGGRKLVRVMVLNMTAANVYVWYRATNLKTLKGGLTSQYMPIGPDIAGIGGATGNPSTAVTPYSSVWRDITANIPDLLSIVCTSDVAGATPVPNEPLVSNNTGVIIEMEAYD